MCVSDLSASSRGGVVDVVFEILQYGNPILSFSAAQNKKHILCLIQALSPPPPPPPAYDVAKLLCCDISVDLH